MVNKITYANKFQYKPTCTIHEIIKQLPDLDEGYTTLESRAKTVGTFGSSRVSTEILSDIQLSPLLIKDILSNKRNIVHGGGSYGLMGTFTTSGRIHSTKDHSGKPLQNLAIIMNPPYGDEDIHSCLPIGTAPTEEARVQKFMQVADTFLIQKGSTATLKEATSVVGTNKNIILIGKEFFAGLKKQYQQLFTAGYIEYKPEDLFELFDAKKDRTKILNEIINPSRPFDSINLTQKAKNEQLAIKELSDGIVVYKGGIETLKKAMSLIQLNDYTVGTPLKKILLVGDFFNGLKEQYQAVNNAKLLRHNPQELFKFISTREAKKFGRLL